MGFKKVMVGYLARWSGFKSFLNKYYELKRESPVMIDFLWTMFEMFLVVAFFIAVLSWFDIGTHAVYKQVFNVSSFNVSNSSWSWNASKII